MAWIAERNQNRVSLSFERRLGEGETAVETLSENLRRGIDARLELEAHCLQSITSTLEALSPERVMARGFIACETPVGVPVVTASAAAGQDSLRLLFSDGKVPVKVEGPAEYRKEIS